MCNFRNAVDTVRSNQKWLFVSENAMYNFTYFMKLYTHWNIFIVCHVDYHFRIMEMTHRIKSKNNWYKRDFCQNSWIWSRKPKYREKNHCFWMILRIRSGLRYLIAPLEEFGMVCKKLTELIEQTFNREGSLYLACNDKNAFFTSEQL